MNINNLCIDRDITIKEALKKLNNTGKKILFVVDDKKLIGTITDGDIRRWILKNEPLSYTVNNIMNNRPEVLYKKDRARAKRVMKKKNIQAMPIINSKDELTSVIFWNDVFDDSFKLYDNISLPVVIMAGGKGTRLLPYTKVLPKPLIPIGEVTIVERIIQKFKEFDCREFYLTLNYRANMVKAYFNDIKKDYNIYFVEENKPLGTAGSLYMLKDKINSTFVLSNCDILVDADYGDALKYHKDRKNKITMITSLKHQVIPYGVIHLNGEGYVKEIAEKPEFGYLVNTGVYILEPEVLNDIPDETFYHITYLINEYLKNGVNVGTYPVGEDSWLDMGQIEEMKNMIKKLDL